MVATGGLSAAFIEPALAYLAAHGASVNFSRSLREIAFDGDRAAAIAFDEETVALAPDDQVVLATPPVVTRALIPGLVVPETFHAIVNAHFRVAPPDGQPLILGVVNGADRMALRLSRPAVGDDQLRRPADGRAAQALAEAIWRKSPA